MSSTVNNAAKLVDAASLVSDVLKNGTVILDQPTVRQTLKEGFAASYMLTAGGITGSITGVLSGIATTGATLGVGIPAAPIIGVTAGLVTAEADQMLADLIQGPFKGKKFKFHHTDPATGQRKVMELGG